MKNQFFIATFFILSSGLAQAEVVSISHTASAETCDLAQAYASLPPLRQCQNASGSSIGDTVYSNVQESNGVCTLTATIQCVIPN